MAEDEEAVEDACIVCGSTDFYQTPSGETCCSNCFTQSQVQTVQEELEFEDIDQLAGRNNRFSVGGGYRHLGYTRGTSSGHARRKFVCFQDIDRSKPLPSLEQCLSAFQTVLKTAAVKICALIGMTTTSSSDAMLDCVKNIWFSYLSTWAEAADMYGTKYPLVRFAMRDAFLSCLQVQRLLVNLKYKARKRLEEISTIAPKGEIKSTKNKRRKIPKKEHQTMTATTAQDAENAESQKNRPRNRFEGYETRTEKEAKKFYPEYFFQNEYRDPSGYLGTREQIFQMLKEEHPDTSPSIITKHEAALRLHAPSMRFLLAILHCALSHLRAGVSASHIIQFAINGSIPYLNAFSQALSPEQQDALSGLNLFFTPVNTPRPINVEYDSILLAIISGFARKPVLRSTISMEESGCAEKEYLTKSDMSDDDHSNQTKLNPSISSINAPLLACRIIQRIGLPTKVLLYTLSMMGFCSKKLTSNDYISQELSKITCNEQYLPPSLPKASPENLLSTKDVIAVIVIACKLCHGWEFWSYKNFYCTGNKSEYRMTKNKNQMNFATGIHNNNEAAAQGSRLIPWNDSQLRLLTNFATMSYLDFFDDTIFIDCPYRKYFEGFLQWLDGHRSRKSSSLVEEDNYSSFSSADQGGSVISNDTLLYGALSGSDNSSFISQDASDKDRQESDNEWRMANGVGKYIFYNNILNTGGADRLALHPHYEALLNIFAQKELISALDIHEKVVAIEKDLCDHFKDSGLCELNVQRNKGTWEESEREELLAAMKIYGKEWTKIAAKVKTRSPNQIRDYVMGFQGATGPWTNTEREAYIEALKVHGKKWHTIASVVGTRTYHQCRRYYHNVSKEECGYHNNIFAQKELISALDIHEKVVAIEKDLCEHFKDSGLCELNVQRNKGTWKKSEREELLAAMKIYGKEWTKIAAKVKTRSPNQIRDYVMGLQAATGPWTNTEREAYIEALKVHGKKWHTIASVVGTRTYHQCRKYYLNISKEECGYHNVSKEECG